MQKTYCNICEAICGLRVEIDNKDKNPKVKLTPDKEHIVSKGFVCYKGINYPNYLSASKRITTPLKKVGNHWVPIEWKEAYKQIEENINRIIAQYGVNSIGIYHGNAFNAQGMLTMFLIVKSLGTRNFFTAASQDCNNKFKGAEIVYGHPFIQGIADVKNTDVLILLGTNPIKSQSSFLHLEGGSVQFTKLKKRGGKIFTIDPIKSESAEKFGEWIYVNPNTDVFFLILLMKELKYLYKETFTERGLKDIIDFTETFSNEFLFHLIGCNKEKVHNLIKDIKQSKRISFHISVGVNRGGFGTLCYILVQALVYLTDNFDKKGGLIFQPLSFAMKKGFSLLNMPQAKSRIGEIDSLLGTLPAGILAEEILTKGDGQIKALFVIGGNPIASIPNSGKLLSAFSRLEYVVSFDLFLNETSKNSNIFLPGDTWLERFDLASWHLMFLNSPIIQYSKKVVNSPKNVRSEQKILTHISTIIKKPIFNSFFFAFVWEHISWNAVYHLLNSIFLPINLLLYKKIVHGIPIRKITPNWYRKYLRRKKQKVCFWNNSIESEFNRVIKYSKNLNVILNERKENEFQLISRRTKKTYNTWYNKSKNNLGNEDFAWLSTNDFQALNLEHKENIIIYNNQSFLIMPVLHKKNVPNGIISIPFTTRSKQNINRLINSDLTSIERISGQLFMGAIWVKITKAK